MTGSSRYPLLLFFNGLVIVLDFCMERFLADLHIGAIGHDPYEVKRAIVGSIYPAKWFFDGEAHRTPEVNEAALAIYHINRKLRHKKTEEKSLKDSYSGLVFLQLNTEHLDRFCKIFRYVFIIHHSENAPLISRFRTKKLVSIKLSLSGRRRVI